MTDIADIARLIEPEARALGLALVRVKMNGGRSDPTLITARDLTRTEHDILLGLVRRRLRDDFGWTRNPKRYYSAARAS